MAIGTLSCQRQWVSVGPPFRLKADGGALTGSQMADGSTAEIFDGTVNGNQLSWKVSISDPMPLTLEFNGTVDGDEVTGSVTLGNFGSSSFSGTRN